MKFTFKNNIDPIYSDDPFYDLFYGGYIKPEEILRYDHQIVLVHNAIDTIRTFLHAAEEAEILEVD